VLYGVYSDESGNNGFNDSENQPILYYGGILVPIDKQVYLDTEFEKIKIGVLTEIRQHILGIPPKDLFTIDFFRNFEIHTRDFFEGVSFYSKIPFDSRLKVLKRVLELVKSNELTICASVINKKVYKTNTGDTKHRIMHERGYGEFLNVLNGALRSNDKQYGFIISDECRSDESEMFALKLKNQPENSLVYPHLQIEKSHLCNLVQLADAVAFVVTNYYWNHFGLRQRKNHNQEVIALCDNYLRDTVTVWEYN
jgi:hypothetical protein